MKGVINESCKTEAIIPADILVPVYKKTIPAFLGNPVLYCVTELIHGIPPCSLFLLVLYLLPFAYC
jgi:hypothetical protein